jgi:hypothetical protein
VIHLHPTDGIESGHHEAPPGIAEAARQLIAKRSCEAVVDDLIASEMKDRDGLLATARSERRESPVKILKGLPSGKAAGLELGIL